jgi:hypothetical protein
MGPLIDVAGPGAVGASLPALGPGPAPYPVERLLPLQEGGADAVAVRRPLWSAALRVPRSSPSCQPMSLLMRSRAVKRATLRLNVA